MKAVVTDDQNNLKGIYTLTQCDSHHYIEEIPHLEEGDTLNIVSDETVERMGLEYGS